jgi:hypothetical protein
MAKRADFVPDEDGKFKEWQGNVDDEVTANEIPWSIDHAKVLELNGKRTAYDTVYDTAHKPATRNTGTVAAHRTGRDTHESYMRGFVKTYLINNGAITAEQRKNLKIGTGVVVRSKRPKIEVAPNVNLKALGPLEVLVECRKPEDESRPSMHPDADLIEFRSKICSVGPGGNGGGVPVPIPGDNNPPANYSQAPDVSTSTKARFTHIIDDPEASGLWLYMFARYKNTTDVSKSGPWSQVAHVRIN